MHLSSNYQKDKEMKKIESIQSSTIDDLTLLLATKQPDTEIKHVFSVKPALCFL
jgi:hypothetical protein